MGGVVVDQLLFPFSICLSVWKIFAIKVESCQKSRKILDGFFALPNFRGQAIQKLYHVITAGSRHVVWINICDDIPISPEVIDVYTLNFRPIFLNFHDKDRDIVSQKVHFSGSKLTCNAKPLVDQSSPDFLLQTQEEFP